MHYGLVMPAAGSGRRFGADVSKQYAPLAGSTVLECALAPFLADTRCRAIRLVLAPEDPRRAALAARLGARGTIVAGGAERCDSVRLGLASLAEALAAEDWVLVHDAARPCVASADIDRLIAAVDGSGEEGGLLATPLADTLKRADAEQRIAETVSRESLWQAQTPQMFRHALLLEALKKAGDQVTDEASAIEKLGLKPKLVEGDAGNLKVTYPRDLELAALILQQQGKH